MFKVRDGPIDWYFCDTRHAESWLFYRHKPETHRLCRMYPKDRLAYLHGASMEDEISRLFGTNAITATGSSTPDLCTVHNGEVPVSKDA